ncbi:MAG: hypothetical protein AB7E37_05225 [Candidatus Altimarinota bacterium]
MKHELKINIILTNQIDIDKKKIIVELLKLGLDKPNVDINGNKIEIIIKTFEISFNLDVLDVIFYVIFKCKIIDMEEITYKLSYYEDYGLLFHYFLLDFKLENEEKEYLTDFLKKLVEAPYFLGKKEYSEGKIKIKNYYIINRENLFKFFTLDSKILKINNPELKEKMIDFIINTRSRLGKFIFV